MYLENLKKPIIEGKLPFMKSVKELIEATEWNEFADELDENNIREIISGIVEEGSTTVFAAFTEKGRSVSFSESYRNEFDVSINLKRNKGEKKLTGLDRFQIRIQGFGSYLLMEHVDLNKVFYITDMKGYQDYLVEEMKQSREDRIKDWENALKNDKETLVKDLTERKELAKNIVRFDLKSTDRELVQDKLAAENLKTLKGEDLFKAINTIVEKKINLHEEGQYDW